MKLKIFSLIIFILFNCCTSAKDEKLSISPTTNNSNKLRLDGYYYTDRSFGTSITLRAVILYQNGQILNIGDFQSIVEIENYIKSNDIKSNIQNNKSFHGLYLIEGSNIKVEQWFKPSMKYYVWHFSGIINSDTSFTYNYLYDSVYGVKQNENDTFVFKQFSPLPDPSSSFIP